VRFTLLTYNIHKCVGGADRRHDRDRITKVISHYDPDLVLLQEVDQYTKRSRAKRQADVLGESLGYRHRTYFPNVRIRGGGAYGNAILSRFPITETSNIDLSIPLKKRRSVLHARIRVRLNGRFGNRTRTLHVYNLHLGLSGVERKIQLRKFLDSHPFIRLHHQTPIIVGGDFNDVWATLGPKLLAPAGFQGLTRPIRTFPAYAPLRALDSLYVRGDIGITHVHRARIEVAKWASDHLPIVAELEIK
jgi:endonuclease/exonuclease/phosphatase family metal-dependent hydrolase